MKAFDWFKKSKTAAAGSDDVGPEVIELLFSSMGIDERWGIREPRGFTWWGHRLVQRVWAGSPRESQGMQVVPIHAECALFRKVPATPETSERLGLFNQMASLSAFVHYPETQRVTLHCSVTLHQENVEWAKRLLLSAVGIQVADAHIKLGAAQAFAAEADTSEHPRSGRRREPDEMLEVIRTRFAPQGQGSSPFTEGDFKATLAMEPAPWVLASGGGAGLTAEFPFIGDRPAALLTMRGEEAPLETAMLVATAQEPHPQLGSGAFLRLALPLNLDRHAASELAIRLNRAEASELPDCHFLGAWCPDRTRGVSFVTFLPAAVYKKGLLDIMVLNAALRERWARVYLATDSASASTS